MLHTHSLLVFHNIFTYLVCGYLDRIFPGALICAVVIPDVLIFIPLFLLARKGVQETTPDKPEAPGSWGAPRTAFLSMLMYWALLWTFDPYYKYATGMLPTCSDPQITNPNVCSWYHHKREFYTHAVTGPIVLYTAVFNYMKLSRGVFFSISVHRWVGRLHNLCQIVSGVGAILLARVITIPSWVRTGFYALSLM